MSLTQIFIQITCLQHALSLHLSPGVPLPHADELDRILSNTVFANSTDYGSNSIFDYLFGDLYNNTELDESEVAENLDISILDPVTLTKIVQAARKKELGSKPSRRNEEWGKAYEFNEYFSNKTIEFMRQSIYDTRRRLISTRPVRKKYHNDVSYNIGIIYGVLVQLRIKIDNVYSALRQLEKTWWYGLIWHLFLYQKCVTLNVDIEFAVQRMFDFHKKWKDKIRPPVEANYDYESPGDSVKEPPREPPKDFQAFPPPGGNLVPPPPSPPTGGAK